MGTFLTIIHVLVCLALIGIVLLQRGKGADMGAAFGGASNTVFGASGATTFLGKLTATAAVVFMITSIGLGLLSSRKAGNDDADFFTEPAPAAAPQVPAEPPVETAPPAAAPAEGAAPTE